MHQKFIQPIKFEYFSVAAEKNKIQVEAQICGGAGGRRCLGSGGSKLFFDLSIFLLPSKVFGFPLD